MGDQGKRLLIAVALALGVMFAWQALFPPKKAAQPPPPTAAGSSAPAPAHSQVGVAPDAPSGTGGDPASAPPAAARGPEQKLTLTFPSFVATFSSYGGLLSSWRLTDSRYEHDATKGELLPRRQDTGAFGIGFTQDSTYKLPARTEWLGKKLSDTELSYTMATPQFDIVKTFVVVPDAYLVRMTVKVAVKLPNDHDAREVLVVTAYNLQDPKADTSGSSRIQARVWESSTMRDGAIVSTGLKGVLEYARYEHDIQWTGYEHPYLLVGLAPKPDPLKPSDQGSGFDKYTYADSSGLMQTDIHFAQPAVFKRGSTALQREIVGYFGPKNVDQLEHADAAAGFATGFRATIDLGWFSFIGRPLLWLLLKFHELLGNWGVSIVMLTLLVKGLTLYWTTKSMRSMKTMAVLGPQMKELQKKYPDDKQRLQLETMALYKQYGVNPLTGCLPILLQMPIWLALYRMLSSAGELYQQPFIPGWINDLTAADPYYILPIILVVTMFAQARLTPQSVDPAQKMQQRMMQYGMPLMFGVMSFFFPAGLTLYIFTNTCLSAVHSIYMNKYDKKSLAIAAQLKKNQAAAQAATAKTAKDANAKPIAGASDDDADDDDADDDADAADAKAAVAEARNPRVPGRSQQKRRKKGHRR